MNKQLINQIKSELKFLNSKEIKALVHDADIGASHDDYIPLLERIDFLERKLKRYSRGK